jgi:hypothetical protein
MSVTLDNRRDAAAIHPLKFWTDYEEKNGELVAKEWVEWVKRGDQHAATTADKVARVQRDGPLWDALRPHYEAWKRGQDAPIEGIPLDAAPFATKELVAMLARVHIRSVEHLAGAEDAALVKLNIPGIRTLREKARAFVDAQQNLSGVASELAALRAMVEQQRAEIGELSQSRDTLAAESGRRRRSRDEVMQQPEAAA